MHATQKLQMELEGRTLRQVREEANTRPAAGTEDKRTRERERKDASSKTLMQSEDSSEKD